MSGFSPGWLSLREEADHRARNKHLLARLGEHFKTREQVAVFDLGAGTGSNLRAAAPFLPAVQQWTLIDNDPDLLIAACAAISKWANSSQATATGIEASKDGKSILVDLKRADLSLDPMPFGGTIPDLVTAAALFDLVSGEWIERFTKAVAATKAAFYTALTHSSVARWSPPHPLDDAMTDAFERHFSSDKGFGAAAGSRATELLANAFALAGYEVERRESPWRLTADDRPLIAELAKGWAEAASETRLLSSDEIENWLKARQAGSGCVVGHEDLLALPR